MSGLSEILLITLIIAILFYLPKRAGGDSPARRRRLRVSLSGRMRLAIVASILYVPAAGYLFNPMDGDPIRFAVFGVGPVILGWAIYWVVLGYRRHRR